MLIVSFLEWDFLINSVEIEKNKNYLVKKQQNIYYYVLAKIPNLIQNETENISKSYATSIGKNHKKQN